jgi:hypothetical protein
MSVNEINVTCNVFCSLHQFHSAPSVALLLSTVMSYTRYDSLDDAIRHYQQAPSVAIGDAAEKLLSTCIACQRALI